jgi:hypothetical protein
MAVEMIGGPRLCEPLLATGLGRFTGAASRHANGPPLSPWHSGFNQLSLDPRKQPERPAALCPVIRGAPQPLIVTPAPYLIWFS